LVLVVLVHRPVLMAQILYLGLSLLLVVVKVVRLVLLLEVLAVLAVEAVAQPVVVRLVVLELQDKEMLAV
jgi:hypothetical protein